MHASNVCGMSMLARETTKSLARYRVKRECTDRNGEKETERESEWKRKRDRIFIGENASLYRHSLQPTRSLCQRPKMYCVNFINDIIRIDIATHTSLSLYFSFSFYALFGRSPSLSLWLAHSFVSSIWSTLCSISSALVLSFGRIV